MNEEKYDWKLYQVVDESGHRSYLIYHAGYDMYPVETYLEEGQEIETDCYLADILECTDITIIKNW